MDIPFNTYKPGDIITSASERFPFKRGKVISTRIAETTEQVLTIDVDRPFYATAWASYVKLYKT